MYSWPNGQDIESREETAALYRNSIEQQIHLDPVFAVRTTCTNPYRTRFCTKEQQDAEGADFDCASLSIQHGMLTEVDGRAYAVYVDHESGHNWQNTNVIPLTIGKYAGEE